MEWPQAGKVLIKSEVSAISAGTELLVYRGLWPKNCVVDQTIQALADNFSYPLKYGYSTVGHVIDVSPHVDSSWIGKRVFCFNPHESHFAASPEELIPLPHDIDSYDAAMLPNMETAVNLVMDGHPVIGERVCIFGLGVVGLLTTAVLNYVGLEHIATFDRIEARRNAAIMLGANSSTDPTVAFACEPDSATQDHNRFSGWADLSFELSGNPDALNSAIEVTGYAGRIVVGSWYGSKQTDINLGGYFHRSRIKITSSQVSSISPEFTGRWDKRRRLDLALRFLRKIKPSGLITHRFDINLAAGAYQLVDNKPDQVIQAIFEYKD
jgi:threonine dehydrogenase-like Zn-dependent dehydrogenase